MPEFLRRTLFLVATIAAIGLALWVSITLFGLMVLIGGCAVLFMAVRQFLVAKGILNPTPGVPMEITTIEGEFEQVENPMVEHEKSPE